jgi:type IV secretory pathway TrbL component
MAMQKVRTTKGRKKADAELGAGGGVGEHAGAVVFTEHDQNAGADEQPQQTGFEEKPRWARAAETRTRSWARSTSS